MREKIVELAKSQIGQKEVPANTNLTQYGKWFGLNGVAWCGIFVSWVYDQANVPLGNIGFLKGFAGCPTAVIHFTKKGQVTTDPQAGDIVLYDWNGDNRSDHTGIFEMWIDKVSGTFYAIEGNTSLTNNSNGGEVMRRTRNRNQVLLFANPLNKSV